LFLVGGGREQETQFEKARRSNGNVSTPLRILGGEYYNQVVETAKPEGDPKRGF